MSALNNSSSPQDLDRVAKGGGKSSLKFDGNGLKAAAGDGGQVEITWESLKLLKKTMGEVTIEGGDGADVIINGLNKAADEAKAEELKKTVKSRKE